MISLKKLIAIICILLVIFIGMYINQRNQIESSKISAEEVDNIEVYVTKIYMWKEVTGEALPKFQNINDAPDKWVWEVVKKNMEKYEDITFEEIQEKAKEIFNTDFAKQFSKDGNTSFEYQSDENTYVATNVELDTENDKFLINNIKKTKQGYEVEIVEYLEDYSNEPEDVIIDEENKTAEETEFDISIKNVNEETVFSVKNTEGPTEIIDKVKSNIRQLEGVTKKLYAYCDINQTTPTIALAQNIVKVVMEDTQPIPVTIQKIVEEVSRTTGVSVEDIYGGQRKKSISDARKITFYAVRKVTNMSYEDIGAEFKKHHSTVMYNIDQIEKDIETNSKLARQINDIISNAKSIQ